MDIDPNQVTVRVLHGNGDLRRTVGLYPGALAFLMRWVDKRRDIGLDPRAPLFSTLKGNALKPSYVRTLLPRLAYKAGIDKRVHPHGLRHSHAYELMTEGVPVPIIQRQLGHSSLATTDRYLRNIAPADVIAAIQQREWSL
jgi:site-specific recombinase XerD